jgi:hypothetical protein
MNTENNAETKIHLNAEKESHIRKAESVKIPFKKDKGKASENYYVRTLDLEKGLPFPKLNASITKETFTVVVSNLPTKAYMAED